MFFDFLNFSRVVLTFLKSARQNIAISREIIDFHKSRIWSILWGGNPILASASEKVIIKHGILVFLAPIECPLVQEY